MKTLNKSEPILIAGVNITHPNRILAPTKDISKKDLVNYYNDISEFILPYLKNRPLSLLRCPEGQKCFFQKHYATYLPKDIIKILIREQEKSKPTEFITIKNKKGLIDLIQFSTLEIHPWAALASNVEKPDFITFDLDPDAAVPWKKVIKTAFLLRDLIEQLNLVSYLKTSGGKGLHIVIPFRKTVSWANIKAFSLNIALYLSQAYPEFYTSNPLKSKRTGKIFIDYLRNVRGATSVAAYSTRAKIGAPISTPLAWEELPRLKSADQFNISNIMKRISKLKDDPWADFFNCKQTLPKIKE